MAAASPDPACLVTDRDGWTFYEFSCMYPKLGQTYFDWEKNFDPSESIAWMNNHWEIPFGAVTLYLIAIAVGRKYMDSQKPWQWRSQLAVWNLLLSAFSWWGAFRTIPPLAHNLLTMSWRDNFCVPVRTHAGGGSSGLWVLLFTLSKFPELMDTFFIVIHKKPLMFLHYYHHVTVLLYCWHCWTTNCVPGLFFVCMNFSVHALMYGYYFLMAIRMKPKWLNPMVITFLQIAQMFAGVGITMTGFYYSQTDSACKIGKANTNWGFLMYLSYLFLFVQFFVGRYMIKGKSQKKDAATAAKKKA